MVEEDITKNKPKRRYKKRKKRLVRQETKAVILGFIKQLIIGVVIIAVVVSFTVLIMINRDLRNDNAEVNTMYHSYKGLYEKSEDNFITEYNYWTKKYQEIRDNYLEMLDYVGGEDLGYEIYTVTGYSANDKSQGTTSTTSIGFKLNAEYMDYIDIVAVDPKVIKYGSIVFIKADWAGDKHIYERAFIAGDCGGDIVGQRIDVYFGSKAEAKKFGIQGCPVKVIEREDRE